MKLRIYALCLGLIMVSLALATPAEAATNYSQRQSQIDQQKRDLQTKIEQASAQAKGIIQLITASDARRASVESQIASLTNQLAQAQAQLEQAQIDLGVTHSELAGVESTLALLYGRVDDLKKELDSRVRNSYMSGTGAYLELLMTAHSFRDFVSRLTFVKKVVREDRARLDSLNQLTAQMNNVRGTVIQKKNDITQQVTTMEAQKAHIAELQSQLQTSRQQVLQELAIRREALSKVQSQKAAYEKAMRQLEAESRSIKALLKSRQSTQVRNAGTGNRLAWPATGAVVSPFGWRIHPIFGDRRFHTGIDIGAGYGQPVYAAESGTVVATGPRGGYGNAIIIDHGGQLATLYAHLSSISTSPGARVARGTRIGSVGCSGYCTGPHLHFETRIDGNPVDPMQFL